MPEIISSEAISRRIYWVEEIRRLSGNFIDDSNRLDKELTAEIDEQGVEVLIDHLRLCGDIPESYGHDSSEEKLYSKYTDFILRESFRSIGFRSIVLAERGDAADVEAFAKGFNFVADAKAFRLSRTAKNAKDFKVQSMDIWKRGKDYAMIVCPIYQLPRRASQIYLQATVSNVCVFTYSHLAMLVRYAQMVGPERSEELVELVLKVTASLHPSKDASSYWTIINRTILDFSNELGQLWIDEKQAAIESVALVKGEAMAYLARERERIMEMTHEQALVELIKINRIDSRLKIIKSVSDSNILGIR